MAEKKKPDSNDKLNDGFQAMFDQWKEGQEKFFEAQKEVVDAFGKSMGGSSQPQKSKQSSAPFESMSTFYESWIAAWNPAQFGLDPTGFPKFATPDDLMKDIYDPANWMKHAPEQLREILKTVGQAPRFADLATPHIDAANTWREVLDYQKASMEFSAIMQRAWTRAYERYSKEYSLEDLKSGDVDDALKTWLNIANEELLDTQHTQAFMDAQKKLLRAGTEVKARQRETAEVWSAAYQMPTRTEVDDMAKILHELRKDVRKLKREVAALKDAK